MTQETTLVESLREARKRVSAVERGAEINEKLLGRTQQQASIIIVPGEELRTRLSAPRVEQRLTVSPPLDRDGRHSL